MVSIVIASYNAEKTILKTITSCINQTYEDIEVVVVNDASTDRTQHIVEELACKDNRIKLINLEVNSGAGAAKKTGIDNIKGEYMCILDSDDFLKSDHIETLYKRAIAFNADMVVSGYILTDHQHNIIQISKPEEKTVYGKEKYIPNNTNWYLNSTLIKSSLWNSVEYSNRVLLDDIPTLVKLLYFANCVSTVDYAGYYYVQNPSSIQHSASPIKEIIFSLLALKDMLDFFISKGNKLPTSEFCIRYEELLQLDIEEEEYTLYKRELDELYNYYITLNTI